MPENEDPPKPRKPGGLGLAQEFLMSVGLALCTGFAILGVLIDGESGLVTGVVLGVATTLVATLVLKSAGFFEYGDRERPGWIRIITGILAACFALASLWADR